MRHIIRTSIFLAAVLSLGFTAFSSEVFAESEGWRALNPIPVQHAGRVKPYQSFSIEVARQVTGGTKYAGYDAGELVWRWTTEPERWHQEAMIPVSFRPLRAFFGKILVENKISAEMILNHQAFTEEVKAAKGKSERNELMTQLERERISLYDKALIFQSIASGAQPGWIANPEDPRATWLPLASFGRPEGMAMLAEHFPKEQTQKLYEAVQTLFLSFDKEGLDAVKVRSFREALDNMLESRHVKLNRKLIDAELTYVNMQPFAWASRIYLFCGLFFCLAFFAGKEISKKQFRALGLGSLIFGFLVHSYGFYLRCIISERPPVSNMYESIIWVSWAVILFSLFIYAVYRASSILLSASIVAAIALMIAESFPVVLNPAISPLVPVLRSTLWLTVHVLTITLSYGAFALAWGLGHGLVFGYAFHPEKKEMLKNMAQYTYRAVQVGVILLAAGTVLGGVWANYSWGRFWGWDPKETWALIALLGYLAVLHGRLMGWLRTFGFAAGAVLSFVLVVMAWYGVNFVLAAGLHSYGFGGGGAPYVLAVCLLDMAFVGWTAYVYKTRNRSAEKTQ